MFGVSLPQWRYRRRRRRWCSRFFFQAEDGIRCLTVTGVQTCALPICGTAAPTVSNPVPTVCPAANRWWMPSAITARSEERRVGKECISRRAPVLENKNDADRRGRLLTVRERDESVGGEGGAAQIVAPT